MKTKKALAVLLAVVMLVLPFAVSSFAATANAIVTNPIKTEYNDSEYFNPQGLVLIVDGKEIYYAPTDNKFRFEPALNEFLSVDDAEVFVYYNNTIVGTVSVTVNHNLDKKLTAIDNGHGNYCIGCGELHNFVPHNVTEFIPNDDGGIFLPQTETGFCTDCGAEVTQRIADSESFGNLFDEQNATDFELKIFAVLEALLVSLVQMLTGIY